jgi:hypothetical protein
VSCSYKNRIAKPATLAIPTTAICCTAAAEAPFLSLSPEAFVPLEPPVEDEEAVDEPVLAEAEVVAAAGAVWEVSVTPGQELMHFFMVSYAAELLRSSG